MRGLCSLALEKMHPPSDLMLSKHSFGPAPLASSRLGPKRTIPKQVSGTKPEVKESDDVRKWVRRGL